MKSYQHVRLIKRQSLTIPSSVPENRSILDNYFTMEKTDQYWTLVLLWRQWINIGHLFYYGETDQYWTLILLWRKRISIEHQDLFFCTLKFLKFLDGGGICQDLFYLYFKLQTFQIRHESMLPCFHALIPSSNNLQDDQSFKNNSSKNMKICFDSTYLLKASPDFHVP